VTHTQRLLNYVVPDKVHVLSSGRIVKSGGKELALELEAKGYGWLEGRTPPRRARAPARSGDDEGRPDPRDRRPPHCRSPAKWWIRRRPGPWLTRRAPRPSRLSRDGIPGRSERSGASRTWSRSSARSTRSRPACPPIPPPQVVEERSWGLSRAAARLPERRVSAELSGTEGFPRCPAVGLRERSRAKDARSRRTSAPDRCEAPVLRRAQQRLWEDGACLHWPRGPSCRPDPDRLPDQPNASAMTSPASSSSPEARSQATIVETYGPLPAVSDAQMPAGTRPGTGSPRATTSPTRSTRSSWARARSSTT
jgi:hypothetical protein